MLKYPSHCHPEEVKLTKDLCICSKAQIRGSFAALRMTGFKRFSTACPRLRSAAQPMSTRIGRRRVEFLNKFRHVGGKVPDRVNSLLVFPHLAGKTAENHIPVG